MDSRFSQTRLGGSSGFYSKMPSNLRLGIVFVAILGLFWSFASGVASFRNLPFYNSHHETALVVNYIVIGCICMVVTSIEIFGIFAVFSRRVKLVKIFFILSCIATVLVLAIYIIQAVVHSIFRNDIITLCASANEGNHIFFTGFFGPVDGGIVTPLEAAEWCREESDHFTASNIVALLVVTILAALFAGAVYSYYRQLRNETSPATFPMRGYVQNDQTQNAIPLYNATPGYNAAPGYNQTYNNQTYNNERSNEAQVPLTEEFDKPPIYEGDGRLDQKDFEKGYGEGYGEGRLDQKDSEKGFGEGYGEGYGEVQKDGVTTDTKYYG